MNEEIIIKHDPKPKPGWPCPQCGGSGKNDDGMFSISTTETRYRPATNCSLCKGKGRVRIEPLPD